MNTIRLLAVGLVLTSVDVVAERSLFFEMDGCELHLVLEGNFQLVSSGDVQAGGWAPDPSGATECLLGSTIRESLRDYFLRISQTERGRKFVADVRMVLGQLQSEDDSSDSNAASEESTNDDLKRKLRAAESDLADARQVNRLQADIISAFVTSTNGDISEFSEEEARAEWRQSRVNLIDIWTQALRQDPKDEFARRMLDILTSADQDSLE